MKNAKFFPTSFLAISLIFTMSNTVLADSNIKSNTNSLDYNINSRIDSSISGKDREVISQVMQTLDPDQRENVVYVDADGQVYANKPELLNSLVELENIDDNLYETPDGKEAFSIFKDEASKSDVLNNLQCRNSDESTPDSGSFGILANQPPCSSNTGPYRRTNSQANYSWESVYAYLPGGTEISDHNNKAASNYNGDTGYVYLGGWGQNSGNVDAGLMHSTLYDNWSPLFNIENVGIFTFTERFKSKQNVNIKFSVPSNGNIYLTVSGMLTNSNTVSTYTYVHEASGFVHNGGNILKRITSIGQKPQNLSSGSWIHNVHWYNALIGISSANYHTWSSTDTYSSCTYTNSEVTYNYVSPNEETVSIDLN